MSRARRFGQLAKTYRALAAVPSATAADASTELTKLVKRQFATQSDPYGNPWAPYKPGSIRRGRKPPLLQETKALKNSVKITPMRGAGIRFTFGPEYAGFHQTGWRYAARRALYPYGTIPKAWKAAIEKAYKKALKRNFE